MAGSGDGEDGTDGPCPGRQSVVDKATYLAVSAAARLAINKIALSMRPLLWCRRDLKRGPKKNEQEGSDDGITGRVKPVAANKVVPLYFPSDISIFIRPHAKSVYLNSGGHSAGLQVGK